MDIALGKYFALRLHVVRVLEQAAPERDNWETDPWSHPDIQQMTLTQLADLPAPARSQRQAPGRIVVARARSSKRSAS